MIEGPESAPGTPADLRVRLAEDLAAGKTIALSSRELEDPQVRAHLPELLEELSRQPRAKPLSAVTLPGYTMLGEIAQGGQSTVHLARQDALGRHVAVKIPDRWTGQDERARQRFMREARAMARLSHPNIVAIHDIIEFGNSVAIAMEWVDGLTLASLIRSLPGEPGTGDVATLRKVLGTPPEAAANFGSTPVRFFVRLVHDIARAVQTVHEHELLHLDIKPSNVLVRRDGTPLLADFGVVREITAELTSTRTFAGTLTYAPPEQLRRQDRRIGPASDVYSLGMTLYEALAREPALRHLELVDLLQPIEGGRVSKLSSRVAIAKDLENIVHRAIAPELENRYPTAGAFADDLLAFLEHRPVAARPLSRVQRMRRWFRNEPWKAALAAALLLLVPLLLGLGTYLLVQLPQLQRLETEARWQHANQLKQAAYQSRYGLEQEADLIMELQQAMQLDPSDSSLACLVAAVNELSPARAGTLLAEHPDALRRSLGLRLCAARATAGRSFFDADEVQQLRASTELVDKYALALDRLDRAEDSGATEDYAEALTALDEATLITGPDPLLFGMSAWAAVRAGNRARFDAVTRAIERLWPQDALARSWPALAVEFCDRQAAVAIATEVTRIAPQHPRGWELLVGAALRNHDRDTVERDYAAARAAGAGSPLLDLFADVCRADAGDASARQRVLATSVQGTQRIRLTAVQDPAAAIVLCERYLADDTTPPIVLRAVYMFATRTKNEDLQQRTFDRYCERYPERIALYSLHVQLLWKSKDWNAAAKLAPHVRPRPEAAANDYPYLARMLLRVGDWPELLQASERWRAATTGANRQEASYYAGLAAARVGDPLRTAELLATALCVDVPGKSWQVRALLEDAWLRVAPESPPELRDPAIAARRLECFEQRNHSLQQPYSGPWTALVRAEVRFAGGDRAGAIDWADKGRNSPRVEQDAPTDVRERLESALQRYR